MRECQKARFANRKHMSTNVQKEREKRREQILSQEFLLVTNDHHQQQSTRANLSTVIEKLVKEREGNNQCHHRHQLINWLHCSRKKGHPIRPLQMITTAAAAAALNNQPMYKSERERERKSVVQC